MGGRKIPLIKPINFEIFVKDNEKIILHGVNIMMEKLLTRETAPLR